MNVTSILTVAFLLTSIPAASITASQDINETVISQRLAEINQYVEIQKTAGIQDPDLSYGMRKALVLADLLLDGSGTLDVSLCPLLKSYFVPAVPEDYEVNMGRFLDQLDSSWQPFFDSVTAPKSSNEVSDVLLRALFGLSPEDVTTDRHAKMAVLAAMTAPYNQGPVGDCFAVADLVRDHDEYYRHTAKDFGNIVTAGFLTRIVNGNSDNFFFLPLIADDSYSKSFEIDASGNLTGTGLSLLDVPGFAAASHVMGSSGGSDFLKSVLASLFQEASSGQIQTNASGVIEAFAQVIGGSGSQTDKKSLIDKGAYGFNCLTNQPVLRAAECAFAAMAEDRSQDSTRSNINDCVNEAMKTLWDSVGVTSLATNFRTSFMSNFSASYRLIYNAVASPPQNPAIPPAEGGFELYKRLVGKPEIPGIRVETPQDFGQLVLDAIEATAKTIPSSEELTDLTTSLRQFVGSDAFLSAALKAYDPQNESNPDPVKNYLNLYRTPMKSCDGDNPYEVDDIDTGGTFDSDVQLFTSKNAQDLITWCLMLSKKAPAELIPMSSPQHTFNFNPMNPDIVSFIKSGKSINSWIKQTLIVPGMEVAREPIDSATQASLAASLGNLLNLTQNSDFTSLAESLSEQQSNIGDYAQNFLTGIINLLNLNQSDAEEMALIFDTALWAALPVNDRAVLEQTAIRFALANWNDGTKDIYFCGYFNPRTQAIGFGTIDEDKTNLGPMDETGWVNNQQWDADLRVIAPVN